jgi:hypothetical protein
LDQLDLHRLQPGRMLVRKILILVNVISKVVKLEVR